MELGAAALLSFPMEVGVVRLGSLDLFRDVPGPTLLADLVHDLDGHATEDLSWLADPHAEVHQASGMVQVQLGSTTEVALLRLRSCAFQHELSATEVAHQVVPRRLRGTEDDPAQPGGGGTRPVTVNENDDSPRPSWHCPRGQPQLLAYEPRPAISPK